MLPNRDNRHDLTSINLLEVTKWEIHTIAINDPKVKLGIISTELVENNQWIMWIKYIQGG